MTDESAFLQNCLTMSDEDLPKLVFADWLEEQGRSLEAWRIREYLRVYRPQWRAALRWEGKVHRDECRRPIQAVVQPREDPLWQIVSITLVDALCQRYPLPLKRIRWQGDWNAQRFATTFAEIRCRIVLTACGIDADQRASFQAAVEACSAADRAGSRAANQAAFALLILAKGVKEAAEPYAREKLAAMRCVLCLAESLGARQHAPLPGQPLVVAAHSLWKHIQATDPPW